MEQFLRPRADAPLQDDEPTRVERIAAERTRRLREEALGGGFRKFQKALAGSRMLLEVPESTRKLQAEAPGAPGGSWSFQKAPGGFDGASGRFKKLLEAPGGSTAGSRRRRGA